MIKYVEYDSIDEHGQHIVSADDLCGMNKTASNFSPELMKIILSLKRRPDRYYVVINALGSYEVWGCNRNGDAFPETGLTHKSLRTDMGTPLDYGYKTFEYYARLYKHHVNKDPNKSFGEIVFSHWNPVIHRVELIVAVDTDSGKDIVEAVENNTPVAVSMGCKVQYDRCSICDKKAKRRQDYCVHLKNHMRQVVTKDMARKWSLETGKTIIPGMQVFAWNDHPKFFDISKVHIGADRTAFVLGKAASDGLVVASADIADVMGVTDTDIDKLAVVGKKSEIIKNIGGSISPDEGDGVVTKSNQSAAIGKALAETISRIIPYEPMIPNEILDPMSRALPLSTIFSTMLGMGIHPKPAEVQRIVLVRIGEGDIADKLEESDLIFDYNDNSSSEYDLDVSNKYFSDQLGKVLVPYLEQRSCFPAFLEKRLDDECCIKTSALYSSTAGNDYWRETNKAKPSFKISNVTPETKALFGLAAIYTALKGKAMGYNPKRLAEIFMNKPWLTAIIGGGAMYNVYNGINQAVEPDPILLPAREYENALRNTYFSGHIKQSALKRSGADVLANSIGRGMIAAGVALPGAYITQAYNQDSIRRTGRPRFPGSQFTPVQTAGIVGGATILGSQVLSTVGKKLLKVR